MTDLTPAEHHVLRTLAFNDDTDNPEGLSAVALAAVAHQQNDPPSISVGDLDRVMRALKERGLVRSYRADPSTSRRYRLTAYGRSVLRKAPR